MVVKKINPRTTIKHFFNVGTWIPAMGLNQGFSNFRSTYSIYKIKQSTLQVDLKKGSKKSSGQK